MGISQVDDINFDKVDSQSKSSYVTFCQICEWYGYPQEKILVEFEGINPEDEDGFVDKFTEYNYDANEGEKRTKHVHKYDPKLVQEYLDLVLKVRNRGGNC